MLRKDESQQKIHENVYIYALHTICCFISYKNCKISNST